MVDVQFLIGTGMVIVTAIFHVAALVYLTDLLIHMGINVSTVSGRNRAIFFLSVSVMSIIIVHTIEAWAWAAVYILLGEFTDMKTALYFSVVTSTTLGFGDITLTERWQLLSTFQAMGGLILFGVTTAFLFEMLRPVFTEPSERR